MSAFDLFQLATTYLSEGDRKTAADKLQKAIEQIDRDGIDAHMRDDLASLRRSILTNHREELLAGGNAAL